MRPSSHRWFRKQQGLVIGVLTASTATGQLLFLPILAHFVEQGGWRIAVAIVVGALLLALTIVSLGMRSDPSDIGERSYGAENDKTCPDTSNETDPVREAINALVRGMRSLDFWLLAGSFFICGASTNGLIGTHLIPACMDHGMLEVHAAGLLAMMGIFDLVRDNRIGLVV